MPSTTENQAKFIVWLQSELDKREWNRQRLADSCGVFPSVIARIMNADGLIGAELARKIADALDISHVEVFHRAGLIDAQWLFDDKDYLVEIRRGLSKIEDDEDREQAIRLMGAIVNEVASRRKTPKPSKAKNPGKGDLATGKT